MLRRAKVLAGARFGARPNGEEWASHVRSAKRECGERKLAQLRKKENETCAMTRRLLRLYLRQCREQREGEPGKAPGAFAPWAATWLEDQQAQLEKVR